MVLVIGEILVDIFPDYQRIGGAPFNFSYHLNQLGTRVAFVSRTGKDALGADIRKMLDSSGFDSRWIQTDPQHPTGRVQVSPDGSGGHTFDIKPDMAYDHIEFPETPEAFAPADQLIDLIYFGTLMQRSPSAYTRTQAFLSARNPNTKCFYDINLRPNGFNHEIIESSLHHADILKLNDEEIDFLQEMFDRRMQTEAFVAWLMDRYGIEMLALTRGANGSEIFTGEGHRRADMPRVEDVVDTVGAGDAYSAILAIGYLNDWPAERILSVGTAFAADICRIKGAVPDSPEFYKPYKQQVAGDNDG